MAMSPLKKQLLSMQNPAPSAANAKTSGKVTSFKPDKTGADRSPQTKSPKRALKMSGVQYENKTPTGKKAPKGQLKTQGKAALKGNLKKSWS